MIQPLFADRTEAGHQLGRVLAARQEAGLLPSPLVLAVPRGGVVVGVQVAHALGAPLDLVLARKLGAPGQPELAVGAVVSGSAQPLLDERALDYLDVPADYLAEEIDRQREEIDRRLRLYRGDAPPVEVAGQTVIVVDDGVATGYTIRAALSSLRERGPRHLLAAVPVAPAGTAASLADVADEVICLATPEPFYAVGVWYARFEQTTDDEVWELLREGGG